MGFFDGVNEGLAAAGNSEDGELIQTEFESFQEFKANQDSLAPKDRVSALELRFVERLGVGALAGDATGVE